MNHKWYYGLLVSMILVGCVQTSVRVVETPSLPTRTAALPTQTLTPEPTITKSPISSLTPTFSQQNSGLFAQGTLPPRIGQIKNECITISTDISLVKQMEGYVVLARMDGGESSHSYAIQMKDGKKVSFSNEWNAWDWDPTHDETLWGHSYLINDKSGESRYSYEVVTSDGKNKYPVNVDDGWSVRGWLDNQRLILDKRADPDYKIYKTRIDNPIQKKQEELVQDYPDQYLYFEQVLYPTNKYNQALDRVVYPGNIGFSLRDTIKHENIAFVPAYVWLEPKWSHEGTEWIVAGHVVKESTDEFYRVTSDGIVQQLTHLGDYYKLPRLGAFNWSPNDRFIAFWVALDSYNKSNDQLAVLNVENGDTTIYCVTGQVGAPTTLAPIWSPDGHALVIQHRTENDEDEAILVDLENRKAVVLGAQMEPYFWLNRLPPIWSRFITP